MPHRQLLGLIGSIILFIGVFTPIISIPIVGNMNYFQNGTGDGVIVLVLAVISIVLSVTKKYKWLLITGLASLALLIITFINFQVRISSARSSMKDSMANNPFGGLGEALFNSVQIQWGWAILIIGAGFLIAASLLKDKVDETPNDLSFAFGGIDSLTSSPNKLPLYTALSCLGLLVIGYAAYSLINSSNNSALSNPLLNTNSKQSQQSATTISSTSTSSEEEIAYTNNIAVNNVKVGETMFEGMGFFGEIKNNGNRTLDKVEITAYFLDKQDNPIYEETYLPVNAGQQTYGLSDANSPLKPAYSRKFGYNAKNAPSEWAKKVRIQVTLVRFEK
jgi:hypothetical protein